MTSTAFGLDLGGFSTGTSGLARADRGRRGEVEVVVYRGHVFAKKLVRKKPVADRVKNERAILRAGLERGHFVVDTPIDLQCLPDVQPHHFVWELTMRPVDFAFRALPALAERIGSPLARFRLVAAPLLQHRKTGLGKRLWESYPAASLELMLKQRPTGYKRKRVVSRNGKWRGSGENKPLAELATRLRWKAPDNECLTDDELDAGICALTGVAPPECRLEGDDLEVEIRQRIEKKVQPADRQYIRACPPRGYVLLRGLFPPGPVRVTIQCVNGKDQLLDEMRR